MQVENIKLHGDIVTWEAYQALPGTSFSTLKADGRVIEETPAMRLGTLVHAYLMTPRQYTWEQPGLVIPIARSLIRFVHPLMRPEVPVTADFVHEGLTFQFRGKPDLPLSGALVIDIKIVSGDLDSFLKRFGAVEQVRGYMAAHRAEFGMIAAWNKTKRRVETCSFGQDHSWWERIVLSHGKIKVNSASEVNGVKK